MGPTWGPPGSCRPQMAPMLTPWTLLSGYPFPKGLVRCLNVMTSSSCIGLHEWQGSIQQKIITPLLHATWWRHQMESFSALLAICAGNSPVPVNSPHKGQWRGALMFTLICLWTNDWVNNREAGDLRRLRVHYDVIVMKLVITSWIGNVFRIIGTSRALTNKGPIFRSFEIILFFVEQTAELPLLQTP